MVRKLLKQEFNYYIRTLIYVLPAVILFSIFLRIVTLFESENSIYNLIYSGSFAIFVISSVAAILVANILGIVRFYKNMYSSEGYLTFSLPVSNHEHIISKTIGYILASVVTGIVVILAWLIVFIGLEEWNQFLYFIEDFKNLIFNEGGINFFFIIIEFIIISVLSLIIKPIQYYAFISIGQTAKKNRIILAIAAGYLYTVILQVISTICLVLISILSSFGIFDFIGKFAVEHPMGFAHILLWIIIFIYVGVGILFYLINIKIMDKKLNLE